MRFITSEEAAKYPALANAPDDAERTAIVETAERVRLYIADNEWTSESEVRRWAELQGIGPERVTAALSLLRDSGRLLGVPDAAVPVTTPVVSLPQVLDAMTLDQLRPLATEVGVEDANQLRKPQLVARLSGQPEQPEQEDTP